MTCDDVKSRLDDYVDGLLSRDETAAVDNHLAGCADCRTELETLGELIGRARALPRAIAPPESVWQAIERRTAGGKPANLLSLPRARSAGSRWLLLAAAAIVLSLVSSALTVLWLRKTETGGRFAASQAEYVRATAELANRIEHDPSGLSPRTIAVLDRNLAIIDAAIREAEAALRSDPGDPGLEAMVLARYQQRLELLQRAARAAQES